MSANNKRKNTGTTKANSRMALPLVDATLRPEVLALSRGTRLPPAVCHFWVAKTVSAPFAYQLSTAPKVFGHPHSSR